MANFLYLYWREVLFALVALFAFVYSLIRTGSIKKAVTDFKYYIEEVENLGYIKTKKYSQEFTPEVKDYILNPASNELEELPLPKNVQAKIDGYIETSLERALNKFLPKDVKEDDLIADYTQRVDDLGSLGEAMELAEEYREQFHLPDNATMAEIFACVDKSAKELKNKLCTFESKEVEKNENA